MKKTLLLILPLLFIMSCDTDDDETSDGLVGTWTVESITYYENGKVVLSGQLASSAVVNCVIVAFVIFLCFLPSKNI